MKTYREARWNLIQCALVNAALAARLEAENAPVDTDFEIAAFALLNDAMEDAAQEFLDAATAERMA
jgi:hypothetical protein